MLTENIHDPTFNGTIEVTTDMLLALVKLTNGAVLKRLLKEERLALVMKGWMFPKNHEFYEIFDHKLQQLFTSGLINFYVSEFLQKVDPKRYYKPEEPKVLTMEHLEAGFVIWLISVAFAIVVFIVEWLICLLNLCLVEAIFKAFYSLKVNEHRNKLKSVESLSIMSSRAFRTTLINATLLEIFEDSDRIEI